MDKLVNIIQRATAGLGFAALLMIFLLLTVRIFGIFGEVAFYGTATAYLLWRLR